jgi:hypothetical protein
MGTTSLSKLLLFFFLKKKLSLFSIKFNAPTNIIELWAKIKRDMAPTYGHVIGTT